MDFNEVLTWLIIGGLAGSFAGAIMTRSKDGYGPLSNIVLGLIGAVIGGFVFNALDVDLGLGELKIRYEQVVSAFVGALILLFAMRIIGRR